MNKAAIVIEEKITQIVVRTALECAGFDCASYASAVSLLREIKRNDHQLIVVDVDDDNIDCSTLLDWRRNWLNPAITVIAIGQADPRTVAATLDAGVDDFVAKPVRGPELLARIAAASRRSHTVSQTALPEVAGCRLDRAGSALVSLRDRIELTSRELAIAQLMFANVGHVVTRARIAHDVWGQEEELTGRSIEQHVYQLRRKLKRSAGAALALRGVYGSGYRLDVVEPSERPPASAPKPLVQTADDALSAITSARAPATPFSALMPS